MTGEPVAEVSQVGGAIVSRDLRKADNAGKAILRIDPEEIVGDSGNGEPRLGNCRSRWRQTVSRRLRPSAVGNNRSPGEPLPRQHEKEFICSVQYGSYARCTLSRPFA